MKKEAPKKTKLRSAQEVYVAGLDYGQNEMLKEVNRLLHIYSVNAPPHSRTATFTPEQFCEVLKNNLII